MTAPPQRARAARARAEALTLVNWRGVFYRRFELDPRVTALEGANGAGKTTVMIAAYLVLLPDMSRLRFTNLGESGATGGDRGIWGRLGEPGRPAYAAMEFRLPRDPRLVAGVHLARRGEPSVEPTPFLVTGLPSDVRLQDVLLLQDGRTEQVPELPELRDQVALTGARLQTFATAKDYFAALFERGVTPMRLATDEERTKLNNMLRTSMTGGISKALTSELRSFLLRRQSGLGDTLTRMRANLDACRRTRTEVEESRVLEREISGVYEAGANMFAAAMLATRERANEHSRQVDRARTTAADADSRAAGLAEEVDRLRQRRDELGADLSRLQEEADRASEYAGRLSSAHAVANTLDGLRAETEAADAERKKQQRILDSAAEARDRAASAAERAQDARQRATEGLAELERGLEELHRRADAHRRVHQRLGTAALSLDRAIEPGEADDALATTREALASVDAERSRLARELVTASQHRDDHGHVLAALGRIAGESVTPDQALAQARAELARLRELESLAGRASALQAEHQQALRNAGRQRDLRTRATTLRVEAERGAVERAADEAEEHVDQLRVRLEALRLEVAEADRRVTDAAARVERDEARSLAWSEVVPLIAQLRQPEVRLQTTSDVDALRQELVSRHSRLEHEERTLAEARQTALQGASELERSGGRVDPELLRIRDELGAELLAGRFEDLALDDAGPVEALLGPLAGGLLVEDVDAAALRVAAGRHGPATVWLVGSEEVIDLDPLDEQPRHVIVPHELGKRVTQVPELPVLGRRARERRAGELRHDAEVAGEQLSEVRSRKRRIHEQIETCIQLLAQGGVLDGGDPAKELAEARGAHERMRTAAAEHRSRFSAASAEARQQEQRARALRGLLVDAWLLEPPDQAERAETLAAEVGRARDARRELGRTEDDRTLLTQMLDVLRRPPATEADVAEMRATANALDLRRDRLWAASEDLAHVCDNIEAFGWSDAQDTLERERDLVPGLKAQAEQAKADAGKARRVSQQAHDRWQESVQATNEAEAAWSAVRASRDRTEVELDAYGIDDTSAAAVQRASLAAAKANQTHADAIQRERALSDKLARREERHDQAKKAAEDARESLDQAEREARPHLDRWEHLEELAERHGLLGRALARRFVEAFGGRASPNIWQAAKVEERALHERLGAAGRGGDVLDEVQALLDAPDHATGEAYLRAWLRVLDWLRARLPAQIAEVDEPLEALHRLRDHLASLEERLRRQELDLRGASEDVARGIDVQIRRAAGQVRRLSTNLQGLHFGSIGEIRVRLQRVEAMAQVLDALRQGEAQQLLFDPTLPIEEALDRIFRRYSGGRTGGQRLLDYREYLELRVEIRRKASAEWELANPTRLSTGEAIGVGAALMMVVLTEWERDANLLRGRRSEGSLRFLFLDEANRLSHDNLDELFDLCQTLELQLLIAAPEVERAPGTTAYRLVRRVTEHGHEEVLVSGRRVRET